MNTKKDITSKYKKLTDVEHVAMRPNIYIGSTEDKIEMSQYFDFDSNTIKEKELTYIPGLMTLFNELINNSYDEFVRRKSENTKPLVTKIKIHIDANNSTFKVYDDGGIPVIEHKEYGEMLPSMLFGSLRSGSNYSDDRGATSGVNGVGASLVNIFSSKFIVETADKKNIFYQEWDGIKDGKLNSEIKPTIKSTRKHFTEITAQIDTMKHFKVSNFSDDMVSKMIMRCIEIAASGCGIKDALVVDLVVLQGGTRLFKSFSFKEFSDFKGLYDNADKFVGEAHPRVKYEFGASVSGAFESIALLNSIRTDYGTHVDDLINRVTTHIRSYLDKKHKIDVKPAQIKNQIRLYSMWSIDAPQFSTQTKEILISKPREFGFEYEVSPSFLKSLEKNNFVTNIINEHKAKEHIKELAKLKDVDKDIANAGAKRLHVEKLIDATERKNRHDCTLFIVEGDSAGNGFRKVRDGRIHGLFKLRGKFTNVFYKSPSELLVKKGKSKGESELLRLMKSLGLQFNKKAVTKDSNGKWVISPSLRYGKIMIMTDADVDGYSIGCQLILLFKKFFPEIIDSGLLHIVKSPIIIALQGKGKSKKKKEFYNLTDYDTWCSKNDSTKWTIQYTKGLGRLSDEDYDNIIHNPILQKVTSSDDDWKYLSGWFGKESDLRKLLIQDEYTIFESEYGKYY